MKTIWYFNSDYDPRHEPFSLTEFTVTKTNYNNHTYNVSWDNNSGYGHTVVPWCNCSFTKREGEYVRMMFLIKERNRLEDSLYNVNAQLNKLHDFFQMGTSI